MIDVSNKRSTSVVNLPSCWSTPTSSNDAEEPSEMAEDDSAACVSWSGDDESDGETLSTPHQKRREWLCRNWEVLRVPLLQSSLSRMEGFIPSKCVEGDCDRDAQTRCQDCSFGAYYYTECCNELHRMKHQFHSPEVLKVSVSCGVFSFKKIAYNVVNELV